MYLPSYSPNLAIGRKRASHRSGRQAHAVANRSGQVMDMVLDGEELGELGRELGMSGDQGSGVGRLPASIPS